MFVKYPRCEMCRKILDIDSITDHIDGGAGNYLSSYPCIRTLTAMVPDGKIEESKTVCSPLCEAKFKRLFERKHGLQKAKRVEYDCTKDPKCMICGRDSKAFTLEHYKLGDVVEKYLCCSEECSKKSKEIFQERYGLSEANIKELPSQEAIRDWVAAPTGHRKDAPEPSLSVIVPTVDPNRPLRQMLMSVQKQPLNPGDEVVVVVDGFETPEENIDRIRTVVKGFGPQYRVLVHDAWHHCWGHCQLNKAIETCMKGNWVLANDDDDIFAPGAFKAVRETIKTLDEPRPILFRFRRPGIGRFCIQWVEKVIIYGLISGHSLVAPNDDRMGRFTCRYPGDYDWVVSTVKNHDKIVHWDETIVAIGRPDIKEHPEWDPEKWS